MKYRFCQLKRKIRELGLRQKTISLTLLFFITAILMSSITFWTISENIKKETLKKSMINLCAQREESMREYFDNLDNLAYSIGSSNWMQQLFKKKISKINQQEIQDNIVYFLSGLSNLYSDIQFAVLLNDAVRLKSSTTNYLDYSMKVEEKEWYPEFLKNGKYVETGRDAGVYTKPSEWVMTIYYPIYSNIYLEQEAILVVTIPLKNIEKFADTALDGEYIELRDEDGKSVVNNIPERVREKLGYAKKSYDTMEYPFLAAGKNWTIRVVLDTKRIVVENKNVWFAFAVVILLAAFLFTLGAAAFSRYITLPILKCKDAMNQIKNNHMGVSVENSYYDEIGELISGFNEMSNSIYDLIEKNKMISTLQKETEFQMLQQQVNPHFLYNTLEIINGLILSHEEQAAVTTCESLGRVFRYNMKQNKWITVREEVAYIQQYLLIMKYKIKGLTVYCDIDGAVEERKILKEILQPLVENCIRHGFEDSDGECCIMVSAGEKDSRLVLIVMDNGIGMEESLTADIEYELNEIRSNPNMKRDTSVHIGIRNVFHRLYLEYQDELVFQIISRKDYGTKIIIEIPEHGGDNDKGLYSR